MSDLKRKAKEVAEAGRYGDTTLIHVAPEELRGLASLMPDGKLTVNPKTGLPEAFFFLPFLAGLGAAAAPAAAATGAAATGALGAGMAAGAGAAATGLAGLGAAAAPAAATGALGATGAGLTAASALPALTATGSAGAGAAAAGGLGSLAATAPTAGMTAAAANPAVHGLLAAAPTATGSAGAGTGAAASGALGGMGQSGAALAGPASFANPAGATAAGLSGAFPAAPAAATGATKAGGVAGLLGGMDASKMLQYGALASMMMPRGGGGGGGSDKAKNVGAKSYSRGEQAEAPDDGGQGGVTGEFDYFPRSRYYAGGGLVKGYADGGLAALTPQSPEASDEELIDMTVAALKGQAPNADAIIQQFLQVFGPDALRDLISQVQGAPQGDGMSDSIPAMIDGQEPAAISSGEYIVPADVVSGLGNGDTNSGAQQLDGMVDRTRMMRNGGMVQPPAMNPMMAMPR